MKSSLQLTKDSQGSSQDSLTDSTLAKQRAVNTLVQNDETFKCLVVAACSDGNCGFTAIQNALILQGVQLEITRERFIELVQQKFKSKELEVCYEYIKEIFNWDGYAERVDPLEKWSFAFSQDGYWVGEPHLKFLSYVYKFKFQIYCVDSDSDRVVPESGKEEITETAIHFVPELSNACIDETGNNPKTVICLTHVKTQADAPLNHYETLLINPSPEEEVRGKELSTLEIAKEKELEAKKNREAHQQRSFSLPFLGLLLSRVKSETTLNLNLDSTIAPVSTQDPFEVMYEKLYQRIMNLKNPLQPKDKLIQGKDEISCAVFKLNNVLLKAGLNDLAGELKQTIFPLCAILLFQKELVDNYLNDNSEQGYGIIPVITAKLKFLQEKEDIIKRSLEGEIDKTDEQVIKDAINKIREEYNQYQEILNDTASETLKDCVEKALATCGLYYEPRGEFYFISSEAGRYIFSTTFKGFLEEVVRPKQNVTGFSSVKRLVGAEQGDTVYAKATRAGKALKSIAQAYSTTAAAMSGIASKPLGSDTNMTSAPGGLARILYLRTYDNIKGEDFNNIHQESPYCELLLTAPDLVKEHLNAVTFSETSRHFQFSYGIEGVLLDEYLSFKYFEQVFTKLFDEQTLIHELVALLYPDECLSEENEINKELHVEYEKFIQNSTDDVNDTLAKQDGKNFYVWLRIYKENGLRIAAWALKQMKQYPQLHETFCKYSHFNMTYLWDIINSVFLLKKMPIDLPNEQEITKIDIVTTQYRVAKKLFAKLNKEQVCQLFISSLFPPYDNDRKADNVCMVVPQGTEKTCMIDGVEVSYKAGEVAENDIALVDIDNEELIGTKVHYLNDKFRFRILNIPTLIPEVLDLKLNEKVLQDIISMPPEESILLRVLVLLEIYEKHRQTINFFPKEEVADAISGLSPHIVQLPILMKQLVRLIDYLRNLKNTPPTLKDILNYMFGGYYLQYFNGLAIKYPELVRTPRELCHFPYKEGRDDLEFILGNDMEVISDWLNGKGKITLHEALLAECDNEISSLEVERIEKCPSIYEDIATFQTLLVNFIRSDLLNPKRVKEFPNTTAMVSYLKQIKIEFSEKPTGYAVGVLGIALHEANLAATFAVVKFAFDMENSDHQFEVMTIFVKVLRKVLDIEAQKELQSYQKLKGLVKILELLVQYFDIDINEIYAKRVDYENKTLITRLIDSCAQVYPYQASKNGRLVLIEKDEQIIYKDLQDQCYTILNILIKAGLNLETKKTKVGEQEEKAEKYTQIEAELHKFRFIRNQMHTCYSLLLQLGYGADIHLKRLETGFKDGIKRLLEQLPSEDVDKLLTQNYQISAQSVEAFLIKQVFQPPINPQDNVIFLPTVGMLIYLMDDEAESKELFIKNHRAYLFASEVLNHNMPVMKLIELQFIDSTKKTGLLLQIKTIDFEMLGQLQTGDALAYEYLPKNAVSKRLVEQYDGISLKEFLSQPGVEQTELCSQIDNTVLSELDLLALSINQNVMPEDVILIRSNDSKTYTPIIFKPVKCFFEETHKEHRAYLINIFLLISIQYNVPIVERNIKKLAINWRSESDPLLAWFDSSTEGIAVTPDFLEDVQFVKNSYHKTASIIEPLIEVESIEMLAAVFSRVARFISIIYETYLENNESLIDAINSLVNSEYQQLDFAEELQEALNAAKFLAEQEMSSEDEPSEEELSEDEGSTESKSKKLEVSRFPLSRKALKHLVEQNRAIGPIIELIHNNQTKLFLQRDLKATLSQHSIEKILAKINWGNLKPKMKEELFALIQSHGGLQNLTLNNLEFSSDYLIGNLLSNKSLSLKIKRTKSANVELNSIAVSLSIEEIVAQYPNLTTLNITRCKFEQNKKAAPPSLSGAVSGVVSKMKLKAPKLTKVKIKACEIEELNLMHCKNLKKLSIKRCDQLIDVKLPNELELNTLIIKDNNNLEIYSILKRIKFAKIMKAEISGGVCRSLKEIKKILAIWRNLPASKKSTLIKMTGIKVEIISSELDLSSLNMSYDDLYDFAKLFDLSKMSKLILKDNKQLNALALIDFIKINGFKGTLVLPNGEEINTAYLFMFDEHLEFKITSVGTDNKRCITLSPKGEVGTDLYKKNLSYLNKAEKEIESLIYFAAKSKNVEDQRVIEKRRHRPKEEEQDTSCPENRYSCKSKHTNEWNAVLSLLQGLKELNNSQPEAAQHRTIHSTSSSEGLGGNLDKVSSSEESASNFDKTSSSEELKSNFSKASSTEELEEKDVTTKSKRKSFSVPSALKLFDRSSPQLKKEDIDSKKDKDTDSNNNKRRQPHF